MSYYRVEITVKKEPITSARIKITNNKNDKCYSICDTI